MPRAKHLILWLCLLIATAPGASSVSAQDTSQWQSVDQAVGDLDLRAASSRQVEQGIGVFGQTGSLYQRPNDGQGWYLNGQEVTQQYQLRQPGFTAWIDRPDYITQDALGEMSLNNAPAIDGQFIDLVPPNTVFDLSNSAQQVFFPYIQDTDITSPRINTRIDGWANNPTSRDQVGAPRPVAHHLPPHLMQRRAERRDQEAQATKPTGEADTQAPEVTQSDSDTAVDSSDNAPTQKDTEQPQPE